MIESELALAVHMARNVLAGTEYRMSVTGQMMVLSEALVFLAEERKPKPHRLATESRKGLLSDDNGSAA